MTVRFVRVVALFGLLAILLVGCQVGQSDPASSASSSRTPSGPVTSLSVDPSDGSLLEAAGGIFRSTDHGRSWQPLPIPDTLHPEKLHFVATSAAAPSSLFAAGPGTGVLRSDNSGKTWKRVSTKLPSQNVVAFAVHSFRPKTLYAWIEGDDGTYRTEDNGKEWIKFGLPPDAPVAGLTHSTLDGSMNTGWLYAATPDGAYISMDCF